jgi:hypothetical protein
MAPPIMMSVKPSCVVAPKALTVALCTLDVVGVAGRLVDAGRAESRSGEGNRIDGDPEGQLELQLRRERHGIVIIDDVEIGDDAENALLLLYLDLFDGDLLGGSSRR